MVFQNNPFSFRKNAVHNELRDVHPKQLGGADDNALFVGIEAQVDPRRRRGHG
jgi:hypothetical protein